MSGGVVESFTGVNEPDFDMVIDETTDSGGFEMKSAGGDARGLSIVKGGDISVLAAVFLLQAAPVGSGDAATAIWGSSDDVASKLDGGGSIWVPASCVVAGKLVWVLVSSLGVFRGCGGSRSSVWMPFVSRTAAMVKHWGPCPAAVHSARSSVLPIANNDVYAFFVRSSSSSRPFRYPSSQLVSTFFFHSL